MICCNEEHISQYCPDCGHQLYDDPAEEIQRFLQGKLNNLLSIKKRMDQWEEENPEKVRASLTAIADRKEIALNEKVVRFQRWVDYLIKESKK